MSVFLRGNTWWYEFQFRGARIRESVRTADRAAAVLAEERRKAELRDNLTQITKSNRRSPGFQDFVLGKFAQWARNEHQSKPKTFKRYMCSAEALILHFGNKPLALIDSGDVEDFKLRRSSTRRQNAVDGRLVTPAAVNRDLAALRIIFNFAMRLKFVRENPVCGVKFLKEPRNCLRVLSPSEEKKYLSHAVDWLRDLAILMLDTGMRPSEVLNLQKDDVEVAAAALRIREGKTVNARRFVPLTTRAHSVAMIRAADAKAGWLFESERKKGSPLQSVRKAHLRALNASGIIPPFRIYDLRHTALTRMAMSGIDLPTLKELAGHSQIQMTMRYVHPTPDHKKRAIAGLEAFNQEQEHRA
jgi:integrase